MWGEQALEIDQEFSFGHVKFQILISYPSRNNEREIESGFCEQLNFRYKFGNCQHI